ncbi:hypothetical protein GCG54_00015345 [Colletotrichum gloeosporioides]|uniref:Uncharacterized protein n=1 Tax=Colletotrichum gloeosporioides TaxID=474922 RepID=A0A8H4FE91_COLGL|nr:uncharacterized protein GCG54_00015345 [Colletotrichum gloeosporioides]KAF3799157.1 hypothetical protein GCG54_00015345 [Colletotrichum gloeosporioides]
MDLRQVSRQSQAAQLPFSLAILGEPTSTNLKAYEDWIGTEQDIRPVPRDNLRTSVCEKAGMDLSIAAKTAHITFLFAWLPSTSGNVAPFGIDCSVLAGGSTISGTIQVDGMAMKEDAMIMSEISDEGARKGRMIKQLQEK